MCGRASPQVSKSIVLTWSVVLYQSVNQRAELTASVGQYELIVTILNMRVLRRLVVGCHGDLGALAVKQEEEEGAAAGRGGGRARGRSRRTGQWPSTRLHILYCTAHGRSRELSCSLSSDVSLGLYRNSRARSRPTPSASAASRGITARTPKVRAHHLYILRVHSLLASRLGEPELSVVLRDRACWILTASRLVHHGSVHGKLGPLDQGMGPREEGLHPDTQRKQGRRRVCIRATTIP